jgi:hypothetical protein
MRTQTRSEGPELLQTLPVYEHAVGTIGNILNHIDLLSCNYCISDWIELI